MSNYIVKIKSIKKVTHDVLQIVTEKPKNYNFVSGQATEVSINKDNWRNKRNPFTFTCLPDKNFLEFTIKTYPERKGVTNELLSLTQGDELILHEVFGTINYKGEGVFIAGGAGVTPFISILRYLESKKKIDNNKLIFANKTEGDIIYKQEFENLFGENFINILSDEKVEKYFYGRITEDFLKENIGRTDQYFYVCGPPPMIETVEQQLTHLEVNKNYIIKEIF
ncbi:MAG: flavodoxin reductase [Bacteroidetes bacterium]|nr:flavodoxin reductase [Bacteroidota bacterium]